MAKRSRTNKPTSAANNDSTAGGVGPRQPCPCGSGRRFKACHGAAGGPAPVFVPRPFAGLPSECDVIALRELVPAATAPLPLKNSDRIVQLCTILPMGSPAMVRDTGEIWLALQVQHSFGDPARDLGAVLTEALDSEPGVIGLLNPPGEGPRLQDLVEADPLVITVHDGFDFWLADVDEDLETKTSALESANQSAYPTVRLSAVEAAYWTDVGTKEHLRWVMPQPEDQLLDALARVHAAGLDSIAEGSRLVGMFRAHGLLAPVWDLPLGTGAAVLEDSAAAFAGHLEASLSDDSPLTTEQRAARSGLANRQVTIR